MHTTTTLSARLHPIRFNATVEEHPALYRPAAAFVSNVSAYEDIELAMSRLEQGKENPLVLGPRAAIPPLYDQPDVFRTLPVRPKAHAAFGGGCISAVGALPGTA